VTERAQPACGVPAASPSPTPGSGVAPGRRRAARFIALGADLLQIAVFPLFGEGFASPVNDALDLAVGVALIKLVGFHWAFLPAAAAELVPGLDLAPTWTASMLLATGSGGKRWLWIALALLGAVVALALWKLHGRL
jgi:hypothetical protein